jgi:subtilisin family serine protease
LISIEKKSDVQSSQIIDWGVSDVNAPSAWNNSIGVVGVAYDSELYAVKVLDSSGNGQISDLIEGIEWAVENDMAIKEWGVHTIKFAMVR